MITLKPVVATSSLRHAVNVATATKTAAKVGTTIAAKSAAKIGAKSILVAGVGRSNGRSNAILASGVELGTHRGWTPAVSSWNHTTPVAVSRIPKTTANESPVRSTLQAGNSLRVLGQRSMLMGATGSTAVNRLPVRILKPTMPRLR
jgi:hypothetical protein